MRLEMDNQRVLTNYIYAHTNTYNLVDVIENRNYGLNHTFPRTPYR